MKVDAPMDTYAARLASFNATLTTQKKRASDAKGSKTLKWPHAAPSMIQLAKAGFFYKPTTSNPDNATCYLCHCNLDGWEEEDEPIAEHLKHSPSCGWANIAAIEQAVESGERDLENPSLERLVNARTMTFGSAWPHENKRGWICKTQKMVEAGWHYCPTSESDDFVRCAYCNLSLDGWEPKDNPCDEHQRRSPDCLFFSLSTDSSNARTQKPKKGRNSKASRMSAQSTVSLASDISSLVENDVHDDSIEPIAEVVKPAKGGKKGSKAKKAKSQMLMPDQIESQFGSSFVEAEDDDFEVKVVQPAVSLVKSKKRSSEEMTQSTETFGRGRPKKRRTTIRDSVTSVVDATEKPDESAQPTGDVDVEMEEVEDKPLPSKSNTKKTKKGSKKRGSSAVRKASSKSTASEASLRAGLPNDEELDAALAEYLDRPLTDDDEEDDIKVLEPPKGRRLTRSKIGKTATAASTAPTRHNTRNSTAVVELHPFESHAVPSASLEVETEPQEGVQEAVLQPLPISKTKKGTGTRKASAKQKPKLKDLKIADEVPESAAEDQKPIKAKQTRGRKASEQISNQSHPTSDDQKTEESVRLILNLDDFIPDVQAVDDDSERESDAGTKGRSKRGKKASTAKKAAGGKKPGPKSRKVEDVVSEAAPEPSTIENESTAVAESLSAKDTVEPNSTAKKSKKPTKNQKKTAKIGPKSKRTNEVPELAEVAEGTQDIDKSEVEISINAPLSPSDRPTHSTPRAASSPQSSDAENQPPSSRPSQSRPPLSFESPSRSQEIRVPLAVIATPTASPSKGNVSRLQSTFPWTAIDMEQILNGTPDAGKESGAFMNRAKKLTSPEKQLTVEEWIKFNAERGETKLRTDCERLIGKFEDQGVRASKTLEGIICVD